MRYLTPYILKDLKKKMVFVGGPRQVGKTTLAKHILSDYFPGGQYFNWDDDEDRRDLLARKWETDSKLLIFAMVRTVLSGNNAIVSKLLVLGSIFYVDRVQV